MINSKLLKSATIIYFFGLMLLFILYQSNCFNQFQTAYYQGSGNGGNGSVKVLNLPTTKDSNILDSLFLRSLKLSNNLNTANKKFNGDLTKFLTNKEFFGSHEYLYSSKSMVVRHKIKIFNINPVNYFKNKINELKKAGYIQKEEGITDDKLFLSSSKSTPVKIIPNYKTIINAIELNLTPKDSNIELNKLGIENQLNKKLLNIKSSIQPSPRTKNNNSFILIIALLGIVITTSLIYIFKPKK